MSSAVIAAVLSLGIAVAGSLPATAPAQTATSPALKASAGGDVPGWLYPGAEARPIPLTLSNPTNGTIYFTDLTAALQSSPAPGCSLDWFRLTQAAIPGAGVAVPAGGSVTLPAQGVSAPTIRMLESNTNQDACQNAKVTLSYDWSTAGGTEAAPAGISRGKAGGGAGTQARPAQGSDGSGGSLPFTGLVLWLLAAGGLLLALAGVALRRAVTAPGGPTADQAESRR